MLSAGCASLPSHLASRFPVDDRTLARSPAVADDNDDSVGLKNNDFIDDGVGVVCDVISGVVTFEAGVALSLSDNGLSMLMA